MSVKAENALTLTQRLFPQVDRESAESRFYATQNRMAAAISEYRCENHLTQKDLANRLGVTQAMVSKYESGDYNISLKAAFELFDKIGIRFDCTLEPIRDDEDRGLLSNPAYTQPIREDSAVLTGKDDLISAS